MNRERSERKAGGAEHRPYSFKKVLTSCSYYIIIIVATERRYAMSQKKIGRPPSPDSKHTMFRVRLDDESVKLLDECAEKLQTSRSEVVRKGIKRIHDDIE